METQPTFPPGWVSRDGVKRTGMELYMPSDEGSSSLLSEQKEMVLNIIQKTLQEQGIFMNQETESQESIKRIKPNTIFSKWVQCESEAGMSKHLLWEMEAIPDGFLLHARLFLGNKRHEVQSGKRLVPMHDFVEYLRYGYPHVFPRISMQVDDFVYDVGRYPDQIRFAPKNGGDLGVHEYSEVIVYWGEMLTILSQCGLWSMAKNIVEALRENHGDYLYQDVHAQATRQLEPNSTHVPTSPDHMTLFKKLTEAMMEQGQLQKDIVARLEKLDRPQEPPRLPPEQVILESPAQMQSGALVAREPDPPAQSTRQRIFRVAKGVLRATAETAKDVAAKTLAEMVDRLGRG